MPAVPPCLRPSLTVRLFLPSIGGKSRSYLALPFFGAGSGVLLDCSPSRSAFSLGHFISVDESAASVSLHRP